MKIIAVINQKGGVGKTTTTVNLGAALARLGKRILLLDMDPQANLTLHVDCRPELDEPTMTQLLLEDRPLAELIRSTRIDSLAVVPTDTSLGGVDQALANRIGRETILREAFAAYGSGGGDSFDYALIDCPPSLGVLSANALVAADEVLIPMQTEYFSLQGMAKLTEVIQLVQRRLNPGLAILCVVPCMVDLRTRLSEEVLSEIQAHFGDLLAENHIRNNVKLAEAPSFGLSIFDHAPESNGAQDYWAFAVEVLARHGETVPQSVAAAPPVAARTVDPGAPEVAAVAEVSAVPAVPEVSADPEVAETAEESVEPEPAAAGSPAPEPPVAKPPEATGSPAEVPRPPAAAPAPAAAASSSSQGPPANSVEAENT